MRQHWIRVVLIACVPLGSARASSALLGLGRATPGQGNLQASRVR